MAGGQLHWEAVLAGAASASFPGPCSMSGVSSTQQQFGLVVAYLLPGFIGLAGVAPLVPAVTSWLAPVEQGDLGFGPPIYALLSAATVGMIASCIRWLVVDHLLEWTGVPQAVRGYEKLSAHLDTFDYLIDVHYRYYQFYANTLVALVWAYGLNRGMGTLPFLGLGTDLGMFLLGAVLLAGARDTLTKYRLKLGRVLDSVAEKGTSGEVMTNGADHHEGGGSAKPQAEQVRPTKREASSKAPPAEAKGTKAAK